MVSPWPQPWGEASVMWADGAVPRNLVPARGWLGTGFRLAAGLRRPLWSLSGKACLPHGAPVAWRPSPPPWVPVAVLSGTWRLSAPRWADASCPGAGQSLTLACSPRQVWLLPWTADAQPPCVGPAVGCCGAAGPLVLFLLDLICDLEGGSPLLRLRSLGYLVS